jgi:ankyrin repeat protein
MIERGFDVNIKGMWSTTPLIAACQYNHESVVLRLLEVQGIDIYHANQKGGVALTYACLGGMSEAVEKLLSMGARALPQDVVIYNSETDKNDYIAPLSAAVINGHLSIVMNLLKFASEGVESQPVDEVFRQYSSVNGPTTSPKVVVSGVTPLMLACKYSHPEIVDYLIKCNANSNLTDSEGNNLLHYACRSKGADTTLAILRDTQVLSPHLINTVDMVSGDSLLHLCCDGKNVAAAEIILRFLFSDEGKSMLRLERKSNPAFQAAAIAAVVQGFVGFACTNATRKITNTETSNIHDNCHLPRSINLYKNRMGKTPLHIAVKRRSADLVDLLLRYGFEPEIKDDSGISPRDLALKLPKTSPILHNIDKFITAKALKADSVIEKEEFVAIEDTDAFSRTPLLLAPLSSEENHLSTPSRTVNSEGGARDNSNHVSLPLTNVKTCPATPAKSTIKKKSVLLQSPRSRQDLFNEKRNLRHQADFTKDESASDTILHEEDNIYPETETDGNDNNTITWEKNDSVEPPTVDFTTPVKSNGTVVSPEYTSGAKLNVAPTYSGSNENYKTVTSAPKKSSTAINSTGSSKKLSKSSLLLPPPKLSFKNNIQ